MQNLTSNTQAVSRNPITAILIVLSVLSLLPIGIMAVYFSGENLLLSVSSIAILLTIVAVVGLMKQQKWAMGLSALVIVLAVYYSVLLANLAGWKSRFSSPTSDEHRDCADIKIEGLHIECPPPPGAPGLAY